jgi:hypothetical protein
MDAAEPRDVDEFDAVVAVLRAASSGTDHESLVNRCHVAADEIQRLLAAADKLAEALDGMWCDDCGDVKCTDCLTNEAHGTCVEDCPTCCQLHSNATSHLRYAARDAALADWEVARRG